MGRGSDATSGMGAWLGPDPSADVAREGADPVFGIHAIGLGRRRGKAGSDRRQQVTREARKRRLNGLTAS